MSNFPETLGLGQIISRELKEEIERRYNTYVELERQLDAKQAEVDALMLEYCPSEMSQEQLENWAAHQRPAKEQGK